MTGNGTGDGRPTVDVVIPVYRPTDKLVKLLHMLDEQDYPIGKIIVMNTERRYWNDEKFADVPGLEVHHVAKEQFDHGGTRNEGASYSRADICVFMTDDAVPEDRELIKELAAGFQKTGPCGERVAQVYARQTPANGCRLIERYIRSFNYPEESRIKTKADLPKLGIKTFFASNVCCAYDMEIFRKAGGFTPVTIFNEDMIYASGMIQSGKAIFYAAKARVKHSHNYSCMQQLHRNFDLGVSQADHPEVFGGVKSEGEGIRMVKQTAGWLVREGKAWLIPYLVMLSGCKYLGYLLGRRYRKLPRRLVVTLSMNREYWKRKQG